MAASYQANASSSVVQDGNNTRDNIECECDYNDGDLDKAWADDFSQFTETQAQNSSTYKQDFWKKLEDEWKEISSQEEGHPWLSDFTSFEPFKEYKYSQDNPVQDHPNALEEGKKMLALGDLPSAVLYFESAVQQQPENSEAWQLLGNVSKRYSVCFDF